MKMCALFDVDQRNKNGRSMNPTRGMMLFEA